MSRTARERKLLKIVKKAVVETTPSTFMHQSGEAESSDSARLMNTLASEPYNAKFA